MSYCGKSSRDPTLPTRDPTLPTIAGFIRTCAKDDFLLQYALASLCRFGFPLLSSLTVTYAPYEAAALAPLFTKHAWIRAVPSPNDALIHAAVRSITGRNASTAAGKSFFAPGIGYHAQMIDKLTAPELVGHGADFILYFDSDNVITRPLRSSDVFASDGRVRLAAVPYHGMHVSFGKMHENAWRHRTAFALGLPDETVTHSFMTRGGGLCYPSWLHAPLRTALEAALGVSLHRYAAMLLTKTAKDTHGHMVDYEVMGAYLRYVNTSSAKGNGIAWEVVGDDEASKLQPWPAESRFPLIQVNSWERHGLSKERQRDYACILNASDAEANARDDRKEFGVHGAKLMQDWSSFNGSWCARALTGHWWRRKPFRV